MVVAVVVAVEVAVEVAVVVAVELNCGTAVRKLGSRAIKLNSQ